MLELPLDRPLLIVGTDTGVGKTLVSCALARLARGRGLDVRAIKPVESGCPSDASPEEDGVRLAAAAEQTAPAAALERLRRPLAPPQAADDEGRELALQPWLEAIERIAQRPLLIEGAGGLLSPLTWQHTALDLARAIGAEALVVAADRLGGQSQTLLVCRALAGAGVPLSGVIWSAPEVADDASGSNLATLDRFEPALRGRQLALPRLPGEWEARLAAAAATLDSEIAFR